MAEETTWNQPCDCTRSKFCNEPHGHIITGDLRIVKNRKLKKLLSKGPKYREQNTIDWDLNLDILKKAVDEYVKSWSQREGVHESVLKDWSQTVKFIVRNKIDSLRLREIKSQVHILRDKHVASYFKELHNKYVLVPADKAGNNIIFVCKQFYIKTLMNELGINSDRNKKASLTYEEQQYSPDAVTGNHTSSLTKFNIKLTEKERKLPQIYWIPKLHKKPYKSRFIAGSSSCTTTKISKLITSCLKLIKKHCISYCDTIKNKTGVNAMWIINNSLDVIAMSVQISNHKLCYLLWLWEAMFNSF